MLILFHKREAGFSVCQKDLVYHVKFWNFRCFLLTGDRPYKCDACGKEFNYLTTYKRHLNIHKGEKPYACDQCEKKFTRLNYLKNHLYTHSKLATQECQTEVSLPLPASTSDQQVHAVFELIIAH